MKQAVLILLCVCAVGCGDRKPDPAQYDVLATTYARLLILNERVGGSQPPLTKAAFEAARDSVLKASGYANERLQSELSEIFHSPEKARVFFPLVKRKLER